MPLGPAYPALGGAVHLPVRALKKREGNLPVISTCRVPGENKKVRNGQKRDIVEDNLFMVSPLEAESSMP